MSDSDTATPRAASLRSALRTALRVGEYTLALAGGACLIAYGGACARATITQQRESDAFDAALRAQLHRAEIQDRLQEETPPDRSDWSPARVAKYEATLDKPVHAIGRLEIPDVDLSVMVLEGDDDHTLDRAVGHIPGTADPGTKGNLGIAGHRDGYFRGLRNVEEGDEITLTSLEGVARYRIDKISIVDPKRTDILARTADPTLTLVTCYPFFHVGDAPWRYIVRARQVGFESWDSMDQGNVAAR